MIRSAAATSFVASLLLSVALAPSVALAQPKGGESLAPKPSTAIPMVGEPLSLGGLLGESPTRVAWLYDVPSTADANGKIVIHWFCAPKLATCTEDLARMVTLKENGRAYVIAYVRGVKNDAKKLDPIRESEGVGRGTVAYYATRAQTKAMQSLFTTLGVTGPLSIVVDTDGKVAHVTTSPAPSDLDARDAKVTALTKSIKMYTPTFDGPKTVSVGAKFDLGVSITLARWLAFNKSTPGDLAFTVPSDIKCDATKLKDGQLKIDGQILSGKVTCSGPKGSYEARATINFSYDAPQGGAGLGTESTSWKFEIK